MLIYTCLNFLPLFPNLQWKIWWHYKYLSLYALLHYHKARSELENSFQRNSSLRWSILWKCEYKASTKTETKFSSCNESGKPERALKVYGLRYAEEVKSNMRILLLPSTGIRSYNPMWNWNVTNLSLSLLKGSCLILFCYAQPIKKSCNLNFIYTSQNANEVQHLTLWVIIFFATHPFSVTLIVIILSCP